jgi:hypothetical protein
MARKDIIFREIVLYLRKMGIHQRKIVFRGSTKGNKMETFKVAVVVQTIKINTNQSYHSKVERVS